MNRKSIGLPGGPNEVFTYTTGVFSSEGYKRNSPDVSNPFNVINSGNITMQDVDFPVKGTDNLGNSQMMMPGNNYQFPGDQVFEVPMAQKGKETKDPPEKKGKKKGNAVQDWWYNLEDVQNNYEMFNDIDGGWLSKWLSDPETKKRLQNKEVYQHDPFFLDIPNEQVRQGALKDLEKLPVYDASNLEGDYPSESDFSYNQELQGWPEIDNYLRHFVQPMQETQFGTTSGFHMPDYNYIGMRGLKPEHMGMLAHEGVHATGPFQELNEFAINRAFGPQRPYDENLDMYGTVDYNGKPRLGTEYLDEDGLYPRIMDIRRNLGVKPGELITEQMLDDGFDNNDSIQLALEQLSQYYTPEQILKMFNTLASNDNDPHLDKAYLGKEQKKMQKFLAGYSPQQMYQPGGETAISANNITDDGSEDGYQSYSEGNTYTEVISNRPNDSYEYQRSKDKTTGDITYKTRKKGSQTWGDAGAEGTTGYRAITDVFGEDKTGYATSQEKRNFVVAEKNKRKLKDPEYIQSLLDTEGVSPLDLVYGNKELGIPAFGDSIKNMPEYHDEFFDPNGTMQDEYMANRVGGTQAERDVAEKKLRESYLNNVGRTEEEDDLYEVKQQKIQDERDEEWRRKKAADRMEMGHDGHGNVVGGWEYTGQTPDEYYADMQDSGVGDVLKYSGMNALGELSGVYAGMRLGKKVQDEGFLNVAGDIGNTVLDVVGSAGEGVYEAGDYAFGDGSFDMGDTNVLTGNKKWEGLDTATDLLQVIPYAGLFGKATGVTSKLMGVGSTLNKGAKYNLLSKPNSIIKAGLGKVDELYNGATNFAKNTSDPSLSTWDILKYSGIDGMVRGNNSVNDIVAGKGKFSESAVGRLGLIGTEKLGIIDKNNLTQQAQGVIDKGVDAKDITTVALNTLAPGAVSPTNPYLAKTIMKAADKFGDLDNSPTNNRKDGGEHDPEEEINAREYNTPYLGNNIYNTPDRVMDLQGALKDAGYDIGAFGNNKDGVDGVLGDMTRKAYTNYVNSTSEYDSRIANYDSRLSALNLMSDDVSPLVSLAIEKADKDFKDDEIQNLKSVFERVNLSSKAISKMIGDVDSEWLESAAAGILGTESRLGTYASDGILKADSFDQRNSGFGTGIGLGNIKDMVQDLTGMEDAEKSLGIAKTKFENIDPEERAFLNITSAQDLLDPQKSIDLTILSLAKRYNRLKAYSDQFPELKMTDDDIRNLAILGHNEGDDAQSQTRFGRYTKNEGYNPKTMSEELHSMRSLFNPDSQTKDFSSSYYKHVPGGKKLHDWFGNESPTYVANVKNYMDQLYGTVKDKNMSGLLYDTEKQTYIKRDGGEQDSDMIQALHIYKDFFNNKYKGNPLAGSAEKLYELLNRKFYTQAKENSMSPANYIMTNMQ